MVLLRTGMHKKRKYIQLQMLFEALWTAKVGCYFLLLWRAQVLEIKHQVTSLKETVIYNIYISVYFIPQQGSFGSKFTKHCATLDL